MKLLLDWSSYQNAGLGDAYADIPKQGGDFAKAVAVCIASKQCERSEKGVMCPSYRVTGNPLLSPGGRVKLLKAALNAEDQQALFNPELETAMAECVSCKGCKRECENEVDMALIKAEYLAQRRLQKGLSLRQYLFAHLPLLLFFPGLSKLIRLRNKNAFLARFFEKTLGIAQSAVLPEPKREYQQAQTINDAQTLEQKDELVLFIDTFTQHFNPQTAHATLQLLTAAGYQVYQVGGIEQAKLCCGRTYFANGLLTEAKENAKRLLQVLQPHIAAGRWVIGLEPSCILSLRDEYLKLGFGVEAKQLAEKVLLLEEFIAKEQTANRWPIQFKAQQQRVLVHGHCHQKAVGAMKAMRKVLKSIQGLDFELIESSCCGMAGHFGLEAEHYPQSQAMAEQALFPALRLSAEANIVSNGFSCQLQICNGGFSKPQHLAELLYATMQH